MDRQEFITEVKTSRICPENFDDMYSDFMKYQQLALNTLNAFHSVCEKNEIHYQIAYGTLLGIIRDGGQIPWDYDVDVFVPYSDKDRLVDALSKDLDDNYYFFCPDIDPKCRHYMMRVTPKGYRSEALHVDVFYVIGVPDRGIKEYGDQCKEVFQARYDKLVSVRDESYGNVKKGGYLLFNKLKRSFLSIGELDKRFNRLCAEYDLWKSKYCISFDDESNKYIYETEKLWNTKLISLPVGTFRIPVDYESVLNIIYGDYHEILPLEKRLNEMIRSYSKLDYYMKLSK